MVNSLTEFMDTDSIERLYIDIHRIYKLEVAYLKKKGALLDENSLDILKQNRFMLEIESMYNSIMHYMKNNPNKNISKFNVGHMRTTELYRLLLEDYRDGDWKQIIL